MPERLTKKSRGLSGGQNPFANTVFISIGLIVAFQLAPVFAANTVNLNNNNTTGVMAYAAYDGANESVNLATGDLNVAIPLISLGGRNNLNLTLSALYDSKIWNLHFNCDQFVCPDYWWGTEGPGGINLGGGWRIGAPRLDSQQVIQQTAQGPIIWQQDFVVYMPDGSKHKFPNITNYMDCRPVTCFRDRNQERNITDARDGSYMRLDTTNNSDMILYLKDGTRMHFPSYLGSPPSIIEDTNGNLITFNIVSGRLDSIVDTLGRAVTFTYNAGSTVITYVDTNGLLQNYTFNLAPVSITPSFAQPQGASPYQPTTWNLPASLVLPNGLQYTFTHNNFGELTKITYPTGGYTRYQFQAFTYFQYEPRTLGTTISTQADFRECTIRAVCPDGQAGNCNVAEQVTTYTPLVGPDRITLVDEYGTGAITNNRRMTVQDAMGNTSIHWFTYQYPAISNRFYAPRKLQTVFYRGATPLRTVDTAYNTAVGSGNPNFPDDTGNELLPISENTTLDDGQVRRVEYDYDNYTPPLWQNTAPIDNPIEIREFAYGPGAPGPLVRKKRRTYLTTANGQNYIDSPLVGPTIHIMDRLLSETITDGAGTPFAQSAFGYDEYTADTDGHACLRRDYRLVNTTPRVTKII